MQSCYRVCCVHSMLFSSAWHRPVFHRFGNGADSSPQVYELGIYHFISYSTGLKRKGVGERSQECSNGGGVMLHHANASQAFSKHSGAFLAFACKDCIIVDPGIVSANGYTAVLPFD